MVFMPQLVTAAKMEVATRHQPRELWLR